MKNCKIKINSQDEKEACLSIFNKLSISSRYGHNPICNIKYFRVFNNRFGWGELLSSANEHQPDDPWLTFDQFIELYGDTPMKINEHEVTNITYKTAKVGCTKVTREEIENLLQQMNACPTQEFPLDPRKSMIEACRDKFDGDFLKGRMAGNYKRKGFYLDKGWAIVIDNQNKQVLVRTNDIE